MRASSDVPTGAAGNASPDALTLTLQGIQLTNKTTSEVVEVYEDDAKEFKIIDRDQILYKIPVTDLDGTTYSSGSIVFESVATLKSKYEAELPFDLSTVPATTTQEFTCGTGQECTLHVYVAWKNILTRDTDAETDTLDLRPTFRVTANE